MPAPVPSPSGQPTKAPAPRPPGPGPRPGLRRRLLGFALVLALAGTAAWWFRRPLLPVPTPPSLGALDPQVRAHLAGLVHSVAKAPRDPDLRADLALAFAVNGLWAEARQSFLDALRLGARGPLPHLYGAVALQELGDENGALAELRSASLRFPDAAPVWHRLGRLLVGRGEAAEAVRAFEAVTRLAPEAWHGWAGLGEAHLRAGQPLLAVATLERARALEPSSRSIRQLLSQAYRAAGRSAEAEAEAQLGATPNLTPIPDEWSARALDHMMLLSDQFERAETLLALGRPDEAAARLRVTLRHHPTNAAVLHALARTLNASDRADEAWQLLAPALRQPPGELLVLVAASETAALRGQPAEALELARRALNLAPGSAEARVAEANALLAADRDADAVAALRQAVRLAPSHADLGIQLGDLLLQNLARPEEARAAYEAALGQDPLNPVLLDRLARLDLDQNRPGDAARRVARLRELRADPELLRDLEARLRPPAPRP